jgi:hypothetical protein
VRADVRRGVQKALHACLAEGSNAEDWVIKERFESLAALADEDLLTASADLDRVQNLGPDLDGFFAAK